MPGIAGQAVKLATILKDHLGSTDVLHTGTWNGSAFANPVTEKQSFDSWGERRDPATLTTCRATDADPFRTSGQDYDRGYTGHEQLDDSGLIHMNGRIYDPELGRMLSPDPYVQVPEYSQNFNRYSYVMNNPLNLTDPSGFSWVGDAFKSIGGWLKQNWVTVVVMVVVAIVTWGIGTAFTAPLAGASVGTSTTFATVTATGTSLTATGMAVTGGVAGAVGGGLNAALNGGDVLRGALVGALQGAIAGGLLHGMGVDAAGTATGLDDVAHCAGHGVLGGAANVAMGGKFQDGFISAFAGAASGYMKFGEGNIVSRTVKASVVGGTASELGGGKFANGAYTAAFQHLLNAELAPRIKTAWLIGNPRKMLDDPLSKDMLKNGIASLHKDLLEAGFVEKDGIFSKGDIDYYGERYFDSGQNIPAMIKKLNLSKVYIFAHGDYDPSTKSYSISVTEGGAGTWVPVLEKGVDYRFATCECGYATQSIFKGYSNVTKYYGIDDNMKIMEGTMIKAQLNIIRKELGIKTAVKT